MSGAPDAASIRAGQRCDRPGCECQRPTGNVHCPAHDDQHPSLSITERDGKVLVRCWGGCSQEAVIQALRERDLWPTPTEGRTASPSVKRVSVLAPPEGLTVEALAAAKGLPLELLRGLGVTNAWRNGVPTVRIPYLDEQGETVAVRFRLDLDRGQRFVWRRGDHLRLYGLDRLAAIRAAGWCLLVEGESDTWTARHYSIPALGIPGKSTWRSEWARPLGGIACYLWQEPDAADLAERMARDLPGVHVIVPPPGLKDINEAHVQGQDVRALVKRLRAETRPASEVLQERQDARLADLRRRAGPVLAAADPLPLVEEALRGGGYGGDLRCPKLVYLGATSRVLKTRVGAMPAHMNLVGPTGAGKNYTLTAVLALLPPEAQHVLDAASPRVLIYDDANLRHRVVVFGEADSLPAGEDNPAASAIRNLLQDHRLHYHVTVRDPQTGSFTVQKIEKPGPTVLITTATRRLGEQLDSRLFTIEVPDDQAQVREALRTQAVLEIEGAVDPSDALLAYQGLLQTLAPWEVVVPFAGPLAEAIGRSPASSRVVRDYARLLALVKAVAVLRHRHRRRDARGRLIASVADYAAVHALVQDVYMASVTGASQKIRNVVEAVAELLAVGREPITVKMVADHLKINLMAASRRVRAAVKGAWLVNHEPREGYPYRLVVGDPLPSEEGLPSPETLGPNTITAPTDGRAAHPHPEPTEVEEVLIP